MKQCFDIFTRTLPSQKDVPRWKGDICKKTMRALFEIAGREEFVDSMLSSKIILDMRTNYEKVFSQDENKIKITSKRYDIVWKYFPKQTFYRKRLL